MRIQTGWYRKNEYYVVKPLHNGCRQVLVMFATGEFNRWYVGAGIFSCNVTYRSLDRSDVWDTPTSTNKHPSMKTIALALEGLQEIEDAIVKNANGKRRYIYIDGMDERRLRVYTKLLARNNCGYKKSTVKSEYCGLPLLYKKL